MRIFKLLGITILTGVIILSGAMSCNKSKEASELFRFNGAIMKEQYVPHDTATLEILNLEDKPVDSIVYFANGQKVGAVKGAGKVAFDLKDKKFGYQELKALVYFDGQNMEVKDRIEVVSDVEAKVLNYTVLNTYAHDMTGFTQGLEFFRDTLIESTGQKGQSHFRKYDYKTGKVYKQVDLESQYFGEGITVINGKIYQLTWQSGVGFIYNANTLKLEKTFQYDKQIEGWGLANDGAFIYQTDGTEKIWKMDPATQKMVDHVNVYWSANKIKSLNEIEMIGGKIYGNIWQKDVIAVINPGNGAVEGVLDLSALRKELKSPSAEVLNGIAYNPKTKTIFVTGKNWDKMFEIKVTE